MVLRLFLSVDDNFLEILQRINGDRIELSVIKSASCIRRRIYDLQLVIPIPRFMLIKCQVLRVIQSIEQQFCSNLCIVGWKHVSGCVVALSDVDKWQTYHNKGLYFETQRIEFWISQEQSSGSIMLPQFTCLVFYKLEIRRLFTEFIHQSRSDYMWSYLKDLR